ncbi:hypothetical protein [Bradyrhizobium sp. STM 3809]|uniref:hypothetical protein n=1 Tax=Bradyrhizobium sp. STM 3809 TaxID=551936 RepID=UPI000240A282|nr:hypothetical protein [Bradyrhizobium sp. STM 3809]CCE02196.1 exported hypothetical protein [Bradyrhizobium sp. STM 3809]
MKLVAVLTLTIVTSALMVGAIPAHAAQPGEKPKVCRMEQQCRWENFKKICVYVKVCR